MEGQGRYVRRFNITRILAEGNAESDVLTKKITQRLPGVKITRVEPDDLALIDCQDFMDKKSLRLTHFNGEFLKPCPGTKRYICCGYKILHVGVNCPMDCSYCFLQSYVNQPSLRIFTNIKEQLGVIGEYIDSKPEKIFRIGTGEFTDSLALDHITGWSDFLLPFFSSRQNTILELKTKTTCISNIIKGDYRKRIVMAWSLNTQKIVEKEELMTANLKSRILAAKKCQEAGFLLAFHFDPLIQYDGWEHEYYGVVRLLEKYINPESIIWISMGSFRYMPQLKWDIKSRFPNTNIFNGEFVPGLDGKMRYFKPIRIEMYSKLSERLNKWHNDLGMYLCMESDDVWKQSFGWSPENSANLSEYLDNRVRKMAQD